MVRSLERKARNKHLLQRLGANDENLYKLEFIATGWLGLGGVMVLFVSAVAIAHYGFGVPVQQRHSRALADPGGLAFGFVVMIAAGLAIGSAGLWIRRVCARWYETE